MAASVTLHNVTVSYARHPAVHHVSGTFAAGSLTAIAGLNGAGKSTLLKAIAGRLAPDEGRIRIEGADKTRIAYLSQSSDLDRSFPLSVLHLVCMGAWGRAGGFAAIAHDIRDKAEHALRVAGLEGLGKRALSSLSAGQFQRALFARLIMQDASLILLDEPFAAMDAGATGHLLDLITAWHKEGRTVICVLHDFEHIRTTFPDCLLLARECIYWGPSAQALHPEQLLRARFFHENRHVHPEICRQAV